MRTCIVICRYALHLPAALQDDMEVMTQLPLMAAVSPRVPE